MSLSRCSLTSASRGRGGCSLLFEAYFSTYVSDLSILPCSISSCLLPFLHIFSFLKKLFIYFNWRLITLQYCGGFCHILTWVSHGCTCVPHPEPLSHLPPHPIPQGHTTAPTVGVLSHASNLDWRSISHMVIYMFQCYSLISSHALWGF